VLYRYVVNLPDIFDFQGQVFIFRNFVCVSFWKVKGHKNGYIYYEGCFVLSPGEHYNNNNNNNNNKVGHLSVKLSSVNDSSFTNNISGSKREDAI